MGRGVIVWGGGALMLYFVLRLVRPMFSIKLLLLAERLMSSKLTACMIKVDIERIIDYSNMINEGAALSIEEKWFDIRSIVLAEPVSGDSFKKKGVLLVTFLKKTSLKQNSMV